MAKKTMKRYLSICLAVVMMLTTILPVGAYAVDDTAMDDTTVDYEAAAAPEPTGDPADAGEQTGRNEQSMEPGAEEGGNVPAAAAVADYAAFLSALKCWRATHSPMRRKMPVRTPKRCSSTTSARAWSSIPPTLG